ncbi:hypothetical protein GCM10022409_45840 [Hymenobacter glaciei]|uniref:Outer membrane protein beta-barrel domain-containing protein n=1 Tax=Hymenobacter glaciei TaxID=877209 RepID=A0ABP7UVB0_9BACT
MRTLSLALGGLLLTAALPALAQTTPAETTTTPRYYVGLGAYSSYYQRLGGTSLGYDNSFRMPVQLTAGYQLSPRLAVQVGVAYSGNTSHYGESIVYSTPTPNTPSPYYNTEGVFTQRLASISTLARYTLTANPARRLQFDALGGFTFEHANSANKGSRTDSFQGTTTTSTYNNHYSRNALLLTGGVGARYRMSRRFELTYDFTVNKNLTEGSGPYSDNVLTTSQALGLRYRFGR